MFEYCILPIYCPKPKRWLGDVLGKALKKVGRRGKGRKLDEDDGTMALAQPGRRLGDSMLASQVEDGPMVLPETELISGAVTLLNIRKLIIIYGFPLHLGCAILVNYAIAIKASLDVLDRILSMAIIPSIAVTGRVSRVEVGCHVMLGEASPLTPLPTHNNNNNRRQLGLTSSSSSATLACS